MSDNETPTEEKTADSGLSVRTYGDDLWSVVELGERFSKGFYLYGTASALFRVSVSALCIDVLSQDVSKTPIQLRKRTPTGSEVILPKDHHAAAIIERPSAYYRRRSFMRMLVTNLVTASEYYLIANRKRNGTLIEMQGVQKQKVSVSINTEKRRYFYDIHPSSLHDQVQFGWAEGEIMTDDDCVKLVTRSANGFDAIATDAIARQTLGLLQQMQEYQTGLFENGGMPVLAFKFPEGLTPEQFNRLKLDLERATKAAREKGKPFILEGAAGVIPGVEKISLSSVDTEFVKAQSQAGLEACRFFRVPPHKVYLLDSVKYDNQAQQERQYVDDALVPIFEVIEEALAKLLLTEDEEKEYFFWFDREKAYAQDPESRNKIAMDRWKTGMSMFDEMREAIGLNTVGGDAGKVRMFSGNFVLVDEKNEVIMRAGGNAPDAGEKDAAEPPAKKTGPNLKVIDGDVK